MHLNQAAPDFELPDVLGRRHRLRETRGRVVILNFWSAECPHSQRADGSLLESLARWDGEVVMLSIASNRNESLELVREVSQARSLPLVLIDAEQAVADQYEAQTTPHVYLLDRQGILRYRGAVDDVTFRHRNPTRFFLKEAVEALLAGRLPDLTETPAYGCTIIRET